MSNKEPKPASPARLRVQNVNIGGRDQDQTQFTITVTYDNWCCNGLHEVADAISAIDILFEDAAVNPKWQPASDLEYTHSQEEDPE